MRRSVANAAWCVLRRFKADDEFVELVLQVNPSLSAVKPPAQRLRFETGGGYRATRCGPQWANGDRLVFDLGDFPVGRPVVGQELVVEATAPGTKARKNLDDPQAGALWCAALEFGRPSDQHLAKPRCGPPTETTIRLFLTWPHRAGSAVAGLRYRWKRPQNHVVSGNLPAC